MHSGESVDEDSQEDVAEPVEGWGLRFPGERLIDFWG